MSVRFTKQGRVCDTILEAVGHTPMIRLNRMVSPPDAALYAKLEWFNPGGSVKDRPAIGMIEDAEQRGVLRPGGTIVESSSGNLGTALAIAGAIKRYRVICVCDRNLPNFTQNRLRAYGAEIAFLDRDYLPGYDTVRERYALAQELVKQIPGAVMLNQYDNPANADAHYRTTGLEIWEQTDGKVDAVVVSVGTCGTATGVARALKQRRADIKMIAADPVGSILFGGEEGPFFQYGTGNVMIPGNFVPELMDQAVKVSDAEAFSVARRLAREEGLLVGASACGVMFVALQIAREIGPDKVVVAVLPDSGDKYLHTIYSDEWMRSHGFLDA